tara:strand:+ start:6226 stop:6636 length:411 start_codon:yes stop_codon:yes gene_type:complete
MDSMKFLSELKNSEISVYDIKLLDKELKSAFGNKFDITKYNYDTDYAIAYITWGFYIEYRSWGVKDASAYGYVVEVELSVRVWECLEENEDEVKTIKISTEYGWELENEIDLQLGDCVQPQAIEVDCKNKIITLIF